MCRDAGRQRAGPALKLYTEAEDIRPVNHGGPRQSGGRGAPPGDLLARAVVSLLVVPWIFGAGACAPIAPPPSAPLARPLVAPVATIRVSLGKTTIAQGDGPSVARGGACPRYRRRMRVITTIRSPAVVHHLLAHLGVRASPFPRAPARDPDWEQTAFGVVAASPSAPSSPIAIRKSGA